MERHSIDIFFLRNVRFEPLKWESVLLPVKNVLIFYQALKKK